MISSISDRKPGHALDEPDQDYRDESHRNKSFQRFECLRCAGACGADHTINVRTVEEIQDAEEKDKHPRKGWSAQEKLGEKNQHNRCSENTEQLS